MGIWERPKPAFLDAPRTEFGFEPPREHGLDTVESIRAMRAGRVRLFVGLGGNFLQATPDTDVTARAPRSTALTVQISTKLNRSHLVCGRTALILPTLGRTERDAHRDDITALGLRPGELVDLVTHWAGDELERRAEAFRVVEYDTPRGTAAAYYPETRSMTPRSAATSRCTSPWWSPCTRRASVAPPSARRRQPPRPDRLKERFPKAVHRSDQMSSRSAPWFIQPVPSADIWALSR